MSILSDIHRMARTNDIIALEEALVEGANVNEKDKFGTTALHYSISEAHADVTKCLLRHQADVMTRNKHGQTALHHAVQYGNYMIAELLLQENARLVSLADKHGNQPLWSAVLNAHGNYEIVDLLLRHGAEVMHKNMVDASPFELAKRIGDEVLVARLGKRDP